MKTFWALAFALFVMPLSGQTPAKPVVPPQVTATTHKQTAILGQDGGLYVFNSKHEEVGYCAMITGKTVSDCQLVKGHTVTELIQGMIDTLVH